MDAMTVIFACHDGETTWMWMETMMDIVPGTTHATVVERAVDFFREQGSDPQDIQDIITIEGSHQAIGPSVPWWK